MVETRRLKNVVIFIQTVLCCQEKLSLYSIKWYIGITMSISLGLSIFVLFISHMELVNKAQFLVVIFFLLFAATPAAVVLRTVIVVLKSIYESLEVHILDLNIEVLNLIWLLTL